MCDLPNTNLHRSKQIIYVRRPAAHFFNWTVKPSYVEIDKRDHHTVPLE